MANHWRDWLTDTALADLDSGKMPRALRLELAMAIGERENIDHRVIFAEMSAPARKRISHDEITSIIGDAVEYQQRHKPEAAEPLKPAVAVVREYPSGAAEMINALFRRVNKGKGSKSRDWAATLFELTKRQRAGRDREGTRHSWRGFSISSNNLRARWLHFCEHDYGAVLLPVIDDLPLPETDKAELLALCKRGIDRAKEMKSHSGACAGPIPSLPATAPQRSAYAVRSMLVVA